MHSCCCGAERQRVLRTFYRVLKEIHWLPERFWIGGGGHSSQQFSALTSPRLHIQRHTAFLGICFLLKSKNKNQATTDIFTSQFSLQRCAGVAPITRCPVDVPGVSESMSKSPCKARGCTDVYTEKIGNGSRYVYLRTNTYSRFFFAADLRPQFVIQMQNISAALVPENRSEESHT